MKPWMLCVSAMLGEGGTLLGAPRSSASCLLGHFQARATCEHPCAKAGQAAATLFTQRDQAGEAGSALLPEETRMREGGNPCCRAPSQLKERVLPLGAGCYAPFCLVFVCSAGALVGATLEAGSCLQNSA